MAALGDGATPLHMTPPSWAQHACAARFEGATVFHLAARAHQARDAHEADYTRDNADKTRQLADLAAGRGARHLVFLSSIKVLGEESVARPFVATDTPAPLDAYARSKRDAEEAVAAAAGRGLGTTIVRAPLVYGPGARGNLQALLRLADSPLHLPFASLDNRRSFIHVDDLAALLVACAGHEASGRTYLASHRNPLSTSALIAGVRAALGRPRRLFSVAPSTLESAAALCGQAERMRRLTRSLEADPSAAENDLAWSAQVSPERAIIDLVRGYRDGRAR
jgi:nucleoside-diphosphate-sugar epimerase